MGKTTPFRRALKNRFVPYATGRGFIVEQPAHPIFTCFKRRAGDAAQVFEIQWEKRGTPRFIVNFGKSSLGGLPEGEKNSIYRDIACHNAETWGRLYPREGRETRNWFRCDLPLFKRLLHLRAYRQPDEVVDELMLLFPEIEAWWDSDRVGPHMRLLRSTRRAAGSDARSDE